jgi:hypothetical protein
MLPSGIINIRNDIHIEAVSSASATLDDLNGVNIALLLLAIGVILPTTRVRGSALAGCHSTMTANIWGAGSLQTL